MSDAETIEALQAATETQLSDVNTMLPGTVISYDAARNRAVVQPTQPKALADGSALPPPTVAEVPILWPAAAGGAVFTMPIRPGDGVMLVFAQRSLEGWLGGKDGAPDDPRRFDLSDAVALPGLRASGIAADPNAVVLALDGAVLRLEPGGTARLTMTNLVIEGNVQVTGGVTVQQDVVAGTISLRNHLHIGVQPGGGLTGDSGDMTDWLIEAARKGMKPSPYDGKGFVPVEQALSSEDTVTQFYKNATYSKTTNPTEIINSAVFPAPLELPDYLGCAIPGCDWSEDRNL